MIDFKISEKDLEKISEWDDSHNCTITKIGAIGGRLTYLFTPNSLGLTTQIECACGEKLDLTDYSAW